MPTRHASSKTNAGAQLYSTIHLDPGAFGPCTGNQDLISQIYRTLGRAGALNSKSEYSKVMGSGTRTSLNKINAVCSGCGPCGMHECMVRRRLQREVSARMRSMFVREWTDCPWPVSSRSNWQAGSPCHRRRHSPDCG